MLGKSQGLDAEIPQPPEGKREVVMAETVTAEGDSPPIAAESGTFGQLIEAAKVDDMPLRSRLADRLAGLSGRPTVSTRV